MRKSAASKGVPPLRSCVMLCGPGSDGLLFSVRAEGSHGTSTSYVPAMPVVSNLNGSIDREAFNSANVRKIAIKGSECNSVSMTKVFSKSNGLLDNLMRRKAQKWVGTLASFLRIRR